MVTLLTRPRRRCCHERAALACVTLTTTPIPTPSSVRRGNPAGPAMRPPPPLPARRCRELGIVPIALVDEALRVLVAHPGGTPEHLRAVAWVRERTGREVLARAVPRGVVEDALAALGPVDVAVPLAGAAQRRAIRGADTSGSVLLDPRRVAGPAVAQRPRRADGATGRRGEPWVPLAVVVVVCAGLVLRLALLGRSMWADELISLTKVQTSWPALLQGLADDVHPPFWYAVLKLWTGVFGPSADAARAMSVVCSLATVGVIVVWAREAFRRSTGLIAATLVALGPYSAWYGTEARMYAMVMLLAALAGWGTWRTLSRPPRPGTVAGLLVTLVALQLTHYFAGLYVASLLVLAGFVHVSRPAARAGAAWVAVCCAGAWLAVVPWLAFVAAHRSPVAVDPTTYPVPDVFSALAATLPMLTGFQAAGAVAVLSALWPLLALLAIVVMPRMGSVRWEAAGVGLLAALPALLLLAGSRISGHAAFDARFLAAGAPALWLVVGHLLEGTGRRLPWTWLLVAGACLALTLQQDANPHNPKRYELKAAMADVRALARPGDTVVVLPTFQPAGLFAEPMLAQYPAPAGVVVPQTLWVRQSPPAATAADVGELWRRVMRRRPTRVLVVDAYADGPVPGAAERAALTVLRRHARVVRRRVHAHADVLVLAPRP